MNIGIIGFGNLGKAFINGLLMKNYIQSKNIYVCAKSEETIRLAADTFHLNACIDITAALQNADVIVLAVKTAVFNELAANCDKALFQNKPIISLMAGASIQHIRDITKANGEIVRAMPNLAIFDGNGIIGYTRTQNDQIVKMFESLGFAFEVDGTEIEKITAFSACGFGFAAYILDAFVSAGKNLGINETLSKKIVKQNFLSAVNSGDFKNIISAVATKGGATEKGLQYMNDNNISRIIYDTIQSAYEKAN